MLDLMPDFEKCSSAMLGEKNTKSSHYKNRAILKYFVALTLVCRNLYQIKVPEFEVTEYQSSTSSKKE